MADIIATHQLTSMDHPSGQQIYNGLDCCVTLEVFQELQRFYNTPPATYNFERALQGPALEMMLRGIRIDQYERQRAITHYEGELVKLEVILNRYSVAVMSKPVNARSGPQLKELFYQHLKIPEIKTSIKGVSALRMNRETLEKIDLYFYARPIIACIFAIRDCTKKLGVLRSEVDADGRMRTSINVAGTESGRFSSTKSTEGTGTNLFNITGEQRRMFVADPGWKLAAIDLEQAESREVGWICGRLFGDWAYLDACEAGDLHTATCRLIWPQLPWTGDLKKDKAIAEGPFYRHFSYRDMSKRGGHGSNYLGQPFQMARHLSVQPKLIQDFQTKYFSAYPGIPKWHNWVVQQLQTTGKIITQFERSRTFFGRADDPATLREAVAYEPQSSTADRLNIGLYRIWSHMGTRVQILLQLYDAIYFQYREDDNEEEVLQQALDLVNVELEHRGRKFSVPGEVKVGWNWASYVGQEDVNLALSKGRKTPVLNLDGLKKYKGTDNRKRSTIMDVRL